MPYKKNNSIDKNESKILLIIRHAKSSWEVGTLSDFDRPLNDRGKKDAPMMAKRLLDKKIKIDAFVSSPAKRANGSEMSVMHTIICYPKCMSS